MGSSIGLFHLCLATSFILFSMNLGGCIAKEFQVGGKENSWSIPSSPNALNGWAEKERFRIGDSLVFKYDSKTDSVLKVNEEHYNKCNISKPLKEFQDGSTKITLDKAGPFFFISGANGHCEKGEKLEVKVLSQKHSSVGETSPSQPPKASSPSVLTPPVLPPAESPITSGGSSMAVGGVAAMVMVTLVAVSMV